MDIIKKIFETCKEAEFTLVCGDLIELNNKLNDLNSPFICLETDYAIDMKSLAFGYQCTYTITFAFLYKSEFDYVDDDRSDFLSNAINNIEGLLFNFENLRFDEVLGTFGLDISKGIKVIKSVSNVKGTRIKNKFDTNTDGVMVNNLQIVLQDNFNKCLLRNVYE
jgi:hypothetical protein